MSSSIAAIRAHGPITGGLKFLGMKLHFELIESDLCEQAVLQCGAVFSLPSIACSSHYEGKRTHGTPFPLDL